MSSGYFKSWRNDILTQLELRRQNQSDPYKDLIESYTRLLSTANTYKRRCLELEIQTHQLLQRSDSLADGSLTRKVDQGHEKELQEKVNSLQEELTVLYRKKGEHTQMIIDLTSEINEKDKLLSERDTAYLNAQAHVEDLTAETKKLIGTINELELTNETLKNENQSILMLLHSSERRQAETKIENTQLITRLMGEKNKLADELNRQNDLAQGKLRQQRQVQLDESLSELPSTSDLPVIDIGIAACIASIPDTPRQRLECHDGEVTAVRFSPTGKYFVTGGADRKVKIWSVGRNACENIATLQGSRLSITSASFDAEEKLILASSNDEACRVWSVTEQRLRHTFTGHTGKVLSTRFFSSDSTKIVSGSHDRTLKIWDLRSKVCTKTMFAGSSCNDLITSDSAGPKLISGHFDKKVRFWDIGSGQVVNEIQLNGKVTSLDFSADLNCLLACSRDNSLNVIDLRTYEIISTFESEGFRTAFDYTRACFSPDGQYVMCGSNDGSVFIWNTRTNLLEKVLKEHKTAVIATAWHPNGSSLLSSDRNKHVILWTDL